MLKDMLDVTLVCEDGKRKLQSKRCSLTVRQTLRQPPNILWRPLGFNALGAQKCVTDGNTRGQTAPKQPLRGSYISGFRIQDVPTICICGATVNMEVKLHCKKKLRQHLSIHSLVGLGKKLSATGPRRKRDPRTGHCVAHGSADFGNVKLCRHCTMLNTILKTAWSDITEQEQ